MLYVTQDQKTWRWFIFNHILNRTIIIIKSILKRNRFGRKTIHFKNRVRFNLFAFYITAYAMKLSVLYTIVILYHCIRLCPKANEYCSNAVELHKDYVYNLEQGSVTFCYVSKYLQSKYRSNVKKFSGQIVSIDIIYLYTQHNMYIYTYTKWKNAKYEFRMKLLTI